MVDRAQVSEYNISMIKYLLVLTLLSPSVFAGEVKEGFKKIGRDVKELGHSIAKETKDTARKVKEKSKEKKEKVKAKIKNAVDKI